MLSGGQGDIRFVSTYRSFEDIREFGKEIAKLEK